MKTLIAFVLAFASLSAHAEWILVNTTKDKKTNIYIKKGTFALTENGAQVITKTSKSNEHFYYIAQIAGEDCDNGFGEINFYYTNKTHAQTYSYVKKGGAIVQNIGDGLCAYISGMKGEI